MHHYANACSLPSHFNLPRADHSPSFPLCNATSTLQRTAHETSFRRQKKAIEQFYEEMDHFAEQAAKTVETQMREATEDDKDECIARVADLDADIIGRLMELESKEDAYA